MLCDTKMWRSTRFKMRFNIENMSDHGQVGLKSESKRLKRAIVTTHKRLVFSLLRRFDFCCTVCCTRCRNRAKKGHSAQQKIVSAPVYLATLREFNSAS